MRLDRELGREWQCSEQKPTSDHLIAFRNDKDLLDSMAAGLANKKCPHCDGRGELHWIACHRQFGGMLRFRESKTDGFLEFLDPRCSYVKYPEVFNSITIISDHCPCKYPRHRKLLGIHFSEYLTAFRYVSMLACAAKGIRRPETREIQTIDDLSISTLG